ncbi:jg26682, partial [Pararge aegeria aegeria]
VCQRVEDVWLMVSVKRASLVRAAAKPARPVQSVPPHSAALPIINNNKAAILDLKLVIVYGILAL